MIHGYARCSTNESKQDIDRQVRELKAAGAKNIFLEYEHGDAVVKKQLSSLLDSAKEGILSGIFYGSRYNFHPHKGSALSPT